MGETGGGGGESSSGGWRGGATSYEVGGGRQRFIVELRSGETAIVSWKKLLKDAALGSKSTFSAVAPKPNGPGTGPESNASLSSAQVNNNSGPPSHPPHPSLDSRFAPGQVGENGGKDASQPSSNRLNTVIERIERLYVGKASSDEEDPKDVVPDDDEYDTEDSFIDDTELDEYFQVDNSAIKHDGFFVNRGQLERVEPSMFPNEQPKKRRRKDLAKDGSDYGHNPSKHVKSAKKAGKSVPLVETNMSALSTVIALPNVHGDDVKFQNHLSTLESSSKKKSADTKMAEQPPVRVTNGDSVAPGKDIDQQKIEIVPAKHHGNELKEGFEYSDPTNQRSQEKNSYSQNKSQSGKSLSNAVQDESVQRKERRGICEKPEVSVAESKKMQTVKGPLIRKKEGSSVRPKSTLLEKAIRDLEKMVAESRPPVAEAQDTDNSSQAVKRRLSPEIKQKLAKVARLAQASHGKISKELINRLMSIVGHLIQLRTLKRNLKIMVSMGLSAKQEKDTRVQLGKKEVAEMIKTRIPFMKSKVEQQAGTSDDCQEISAEEKEAFKRKYSMDDTLEDKISDLYDLYVEGLEEDAGPQVRKLYVELTALWPNGFMDNNGIKRAICRAKDRRRALDSQNKDPEKIKRKKMLARKAEAVLVETSTVAQPVYAQERLLAESSDQGTAVVSKPISGNRVADAAARVPVSFMNGFITDRPKQENKKGSASNSSEVRAADTTEPKRKKRKPEMECGDAVQVRREKPPSLQGDAKNKSHNVQVAVPLPKSKPSEPQPTAPLNF